MEVEGKIINVEELKRFTDIIRDEQAVKQNTEALYHYSQSYEYALQYVRQFELLQAKLDGINTHKQIETPKLSCWMPRPTNI